MIKFNSIIVSGPDVRRRPVLGVGIVALLCVLTGITLGIMVANTTGNPIPAILFGMLLGWGARSILKP